MKALRVLVFWAMTAVVMVLVGCGGGGDSPLPPPQVTQGPSAVSVEVGNPATFSVTASGGEQMTYQWLRNGAEIAAATQASYTLAAPTLQDSGFGFSVRINSSTGTTTSAVAMLSVTAPPITIANQPQSVTSYSGVAVTLSVTASTSRGTLSYQTD
ncbi:immunoglobulin domain-containing protein [Roseateles chitinivorans]|uniref:immunoglobulin domain-containing protein n=1 Tax=Roseateles chitinivorans TaxID=2917965 RepID=UPI003D665A28